MTTRPPWTPTDDRRLRDLVATQHTVTQIAQQLQRSTRGVYRRAQRLGVSLSHMRTCAAECEMSRADVAAALGVTVDAVTLWVKAGYLTATRLRYGTLSFAFADVVTFLERGGVYLPGVAPREPMWRHIVSEARTAADAALISNIALASLLGIAVKTLCHMSYGHGRYCRLDFPRPTIGGQGRRGAYYDRAAIRAWLADNPRYLTNAARREFGLTQQETQP